MKLLRATCRCGYVTQKARAGYYSHTWWFPVFDRKRGVLSDTRVDLPKTEREQITSLTTTIYLETPRDNLAARRRACERMEAIEAEIHHRFVEREIRKLREEYGSVDDRLFDPVEGCELRCPTCEVESLVLKQAEVTAICKADCGLEYPWPESGTSGCPKCGYRPHGFRTDIEPELAGYARTLCHCRCSSATDCVSEVDGFCPKCGERPSSYQRGETSYCGVHHEQLLPYDLPGNFLFINIGGTRSSDRTPNAKVWGEAKAGESSEPGLYCRSCQAEHKTLLAE